MAAETSTATPEEELEELDDELEDELAVALDEPVDDVALDVEVVVALLVEELRVSPPEVLLEEPVPPDEVEPSDVEEPLSDVEEDSTDPLEDDAPLVPDPLPALHAAAHTTTSTAIRRFMFRLTSFVRRMAIPSGGTCQPTACSVATAVQAP
ncbi:MAG: hypothetical protein AB2A00_02100 [Myxococcota bacterium]